MNKTIEIVKKLRRLRTPMWGGVCECYHEWIELPVLLSALEYMDEHPEDSIESIVGELRGRGQIHEQT